MDDILQIASRFHGGPSATALVCPEVSSEGAPILQVVRKDHVWQFLCGADHSREHVWVGKSDPRITTVENVVSLDPSVEAVATLNDRHIAQRRTLSDPWVPDDDVSLWWM
jgi:hypothetical protein